MSLLPPNSTVFERAWDSCVATRFAAIPTNINDIKNPDKCPIQFLSLLAWEESVDVWRDDWTEQQKRDVIKASFVAHKNKGTRGSLQKALNALGMLIEVYEWFEYAGLPYYFWVDVNIGENAFNDEQIETVLDIINKYKNARSVTENVSHYKESQQNLYVGVGLQYGAIIEIEAIS